MTLTFGWSVIVKPPASVLISCAASEGMQSSQLLHVPQQLTLVKRPTHTVLPLFRHPVP